MDREGVMHFFDNIRLRNLLRKKKKKEIIMPKMRKVAIDPGHGGHKPGGMNKELGFMEKDIVLEVAKCVADELEDNYSHIIPSLTRKGDIHVSLPERCELANRKEVDIFVSIHTNARVMKGRYGLEIETFYSRGSREGKRLAKIIQKNLLSEKTPVKTIDRKVKIGEVWSKKKEKMVPYYVLRNTNMPAVLVELGFLSDFEEAIILTSPVHQEAMGKSIAQSIGEFFNKENTNG